MSVKTATAMVNQIKTNSMPNWVHNSLTVLGKPQDIAAFKIKAEQDVTNDEPSPLHFHNFVAAPNELRAQSEARKDWESDNWGCKWGAVRCEIHPSKADSELTYAFDTAWNPPIKVLKIIGQTHPELLFILHSDSPEGGDWLDITICREFCHIRDRGWIITAQRVCTCGCFDKAWDIEKNIK